MNSNYSKDYDDVSDPRKVPVFGIKYRKDNEPPPLRLGAIFCLISIFAWFFVDSKENNFQILTIPMLICLGFTAMICFVILSRRKLPTTILWLGGFSVIFSFILGVTLVSSQILAKKEAPFSLWAATAGCVLIFGSVGYMLMFLRERQRKRWEDLPIDNFWKTPRFYGIPGGINKDENSITPQILAKQKSEIHTAKILADFAVKHPGVFVFNNMRPFGTQHLKIDHIVIIGHNIFVIDSRHWDSGYDYEVVPGLALRDGEPFLGGNIKIFDKIEIIRKLVNMSETNVQGFLSVDIEYGSVYCHPGSTVVVPIWELQKTLEESLTQEGTLSDWLVEECEEKPYPLGSYIYEPTVRSILNLLDNSTPKWAYDTFLAFSSCDSTTGDEKTLNYKIEVPIRDDIKQWFLALEGQKIFSIENIQTSAGCVTQIVKNLNEIIKKWENIREDILDQNVATTLSTTYDVHSSNISNSLNILVEMIESAPEGIPEIIIELYTESYVACRDLFIDFHELAEQIDTGVLSDEWFNSLDSVTLSLDAYASWKGRREEVLSQVQELLNIND